MLHNHIAVTSQEVLLQAMKAMFDVISIPMEETGSEMAMAIDRRMVEAHKTHTVVEATSTEVDRLLSFENETHECNHHVYCTTNIAM